MADDARRSNWSTGERRAWSFATGAVLALACAAAGWSAEPRLAEPPLARALDERLSVSWEGQAIGAALARLSESHDAPIWVDRRVDPSATVTLSADGQPLASVLDELASDTPRDWGWSALRTVIYFGPRDAAAELATLDERARQAIAKAPADVRRRWLAESPWQFPRLSEPRVLLQQIMSAVEVEPRLSAPIPHDLWPERSLPAIAPIDRAVLLLAGFDLDLQLSADGREVRTAPIKRPVQIVKTHPRNPRTEATIAALRANEPTIRVKREGQRLLVAARWEDHEQLRPDPGGASRREPPSRATDDSPQELARQRFTLTIANQPVGRVIDQLATKLQLAVEWEAALEGEGAQARDALISCDVRNANVDDLLEAILSPAGLTSVRQGRDVTIRRAH